MDKPAADSPAVTAAIWAGCFISFVSFGFAATFGVFLRPMSETLGWSREVLALSLAVQALCWGITQPLAGMIADRFGSGRVLAAGAAIASAGFALRGIVTDPTIFVLTGIIVGIGTGAAAFQIVIIALGKVVSASRRSFIMGLGTASASAGMFVSAPVAVALIEVVDGRDGSDRPPADAVDVADALRSTLRESDTATRLADGRFGVVLEDTPENGAIWTMERVRRCLTQSDPDITMWAGVACYPAHAFDVGGLIDRADAALDAAKDWHQDRIEVATAE